MFKNICAASIILFATPTAWAWDPVERCMREPLGKEHALQRNAWAEKCGFIQSAARLNLDRFFVIFSRGEAPVSADAPCSNAWGDAIGTCLQNGCYAPDEEVMFGGVYVPISRAAELNVQSVSSLASLDFFALPFATTEQPIKAFVSGDTDEMLTDIKVASGRGIRVTANHPLVDGDGRIIAAADIVPGTQLMMLNGVERVVSVDSIPFSGKVWNVMPQSRETAANILVAQGFISGSVRFQNEWAKDESRLFLRHGVDVSQF